MELLPVIKAGSCLIVHACFLIIMFAVFVIGGRMPMMTWIQVIYYSFAAFVLSLGVGYFTAAINVFFKDPDSQHMPAVWHVACADNVLGGHVYGGPPVDGAAF